MSPLNRTVNRHVLSLIVVLSFLSTAWTSNAGCSPTTYDLIPDTAVTGSVVTTFTSNCAGLDAPKQSGINSTVWDWWYFDVVSLDLTQSIVLVFNLGLGTGLEGGSETTVPFVEFSGTYSNGTAFGYTAVATGGAIVASTATGGASGDWVGTGLSWVGSPDMSEYVIMIDIPDEDIKGTIVLNSSASAHYPCGPVVVGSDLQIGPHIGWANAIPDAVAMVDLQIGNTAVQYSGAGYHDKNWGTVPFPSDFNDWYWGHARFGDYSIVWFDFLDASGVESVSAYVSCRGTVLTASCVANAIVVRPVGTPYPPVGNGIFPTAYTIRIDLGAKGSLNVTASGTRNILDVPFYERWIGTVTGSLNGGPEITGVGLWEEINLLDL